ncbi:MAG TPA: alpha-amylase family glycosyl hydrolase [Candidatus Cloacimonadota bacterium]|nr:alpha-amylase family glycosyl hydrolase [Candidatus Cloacimonadota bacterium]
MPVKFSYSPPTAGKHTVGLCGDFSGWRILDLTDHHGVYELSLDLAPGKYLYKLVIDGQWLPDPSNKSMEPDPFGGMNSILLISETEVEQPRIKHSAEDFEVPRWVQTGIVYQIFPDRFHNGDPSNDPDFSEEYYQNCKTAPQDSQLLSPLHEYYHLIKDWKDITGLTQNPYLPQGKPDWWSFYGGDIAGVRQKLDYLGDLGVTILYFNPLWKAKSNHKYDSADFMSIDPHFGTLEEMQSLVKEAHSRAMKIIVDVAFNHTGETFWAFRDCKEKGENSAWWNWYDWKKWPLPEPLPSDFKPKDYYQCWWGIKDMPDLNYDLSRPHPDENAVTDIEQAEPNATLIAHLMEVVRWWLREVDIDGFRLDVPDEVPYWFWELFRKEVKAIKPDAWLVGEIWNDASFWISPRYFDSVMNYAYFKAPAHDLFLHKNISIAEFINRVSEGLESYPPSAVKAMMNLIGSHDTWRVRELCRNDLRRLKQLLLFQFTFIGTPHIYYGDEIGMRGKGDPDNRRPFDWDWETDEEAVDLRDYYRELICLRGSYPALIDGGISFTQAEENILHYTRESASHKAEVIFNLDESDEHLVFSEAKPLFTSSGDIIINSGRIMLPPLTAIVLAD